jgi:hypothetical protein
VRLTVKERLWLLNVIPKPEGSIAALRVVEKLLPKPDEIQKIGLVQKDNLWTWNTEVPSEIEPCFSVRQQIWLSDLLEELSRQGRMIPDMVGLFERFVLPRE